MRCSARVFLHKLTTKTLLTVGVFEIMHISKQHTKHNTEGYFMTKQISLTSKVLTTINGESLLRIVFKFNIGLSPDEWTRNAMKAIEFIGRTFDTETLAKFETQHDEDGQVVGAVLMIWVEDVPTISTRKFSLLRADIMSRFTHDCLPKFFAFASSARLAMEVHGMALHEGLAHTGFPTLMHLYSYIANERVGQVDMLCGEWKAHMFKELVLLLEVPKGDGSAPPAAPLQAESSPRQRM
jgi:hypothetical protein